MANLTVKALIIFLDILNNDDPPCSMEGHEPVALLLLVIHFVPAGDRDLVHLNGAARLRGHQDLSRHNLQ